MKNPILYIVLNGELKMSPGKAVAQAVHSAMMLQGAAGSYQFSDCYKRTVIVLEAKNSDQIKNLNSYLRGANLWSQIYIDEGKNEVDAYSVTSLAVAPIEYENEEMREIFEDFPLYNGHVAVYRTDRFGLPMDKVMVAGGSETESGLVFRGLKRMSK